MKINITLLPILRTNTQELHKRQRILSYDFNLKTKKALDFITPKTEIPEIVM